MNLSLNEEILEKVNSFKYLGSVIGKNEDVVEDVMSRWNEAAKVSGAMNRMWKTKSSGVNIKRIMHERIVVTTVLYGPET